jgi:uncharacterized membrane protein (DUF485 family)
MAGLDFQHQNASEPDDPASREYNARLGLILFAVYLVGYMAYVLINAFQPSAMDATAAWDSNWAVVSGMGLIVGAIVLSLVYALLCRKPGRQA